MYLLYKYAIQGLWIRKRSEIKIVIIDYYFQVFIFPFLEFGRASERS